MTLLEQIKIGISTFFDAIPFIFKNKLAWFFIFPIIFNVILFVGGWSLVDTLTKISINFFEEWLQAKSLPGWLDTILSGFLWFFFKLIFFFIYAYLGGFITLIFLSPVLALLSEKVDEIVSGKKYPLSISQLTKDILRGIILAIRNMLMEIGFLIILFFASFIPGLGLITPVIMFLVSSYFYGFSFIDYSSERNKMAMKESISFVKQHKGIATVNGAMFSFFLLIPFLGMMFAGFAAIISTVGATLAVQKVNTIQ